MTKKIISIFLIFILINILIVFKNNKNTETVFSEITTNNYDIYNLDVNELYISTKNLTNVIYNPNIKIIGITPKINNILDKKILRQNNYYSFKKHEIKENVLDFEKQFKILLQKKGLSDEIEKINLNGVKLSKIKIYSSHSDVKALVKQHPKIKINS